MGTAQAVQGTSLGDQAEALAFGHSTAETRKADKQKEGTERGCYEVCDTRKGAIWCDAHNTKKQQTRHGDTDMTTQHEDAT